MGSLCSPFHPALASRVAGKHREGMEGDLQRDAGSGVVSTKSYSAGNMPRGREGGGALSGHKE